MTGGRSARWIDEEMTDVFTSRASAFITRNKNRPFFLFFSSQNIHVPRAPHARFVGATSHGARGDAVVEFDASVGVLMQALRAADLVDNTLIIVTSDNGPVLDDGYKDEAVARIGQHKPAGPFRGGKYSIFEAGTRVPLIAHWPERIKPGVSDAMVSQVDFAASLSALAGASTELPEGAIPDSQDLSAALSGQSATGREQLVQQAQVLALRKGPWKYIEASSKPKMNLNTNTELGNSSEPQLYNLELDPGETDNLAGEYPERLTALKKLLEQTRKSK